MKSDWRNFRDGEEWIGGAVLWVWARSWDKPRLAIADGEDPGEWVYETGAKLGAAGEEFPTHCSDPEPPAPPFA
jgi:hypothetical protein